jgi:hypothetical protein
MFFFGFNNYFIFFSKGVHGDVEQDPGGHFNFFLELFLLTCPNVDQRAVVQPDPLLLPPVHRGRAWKG